MKALFISACVREESRTLILCREYMEKHWNGGDVSVREVDLNAEKPKPFDREKLRQRDSDIDARNFTDCRYDFAKDFAAADSILIGAPYWDYSFPALLKAYFEHVCVNGITFGYVEGVLTGFCHAKELIYITTAGGYIGDTSSLEVYLGEMCRMFGIPELRFYKAEGLDIVGNDAKKILENAAKAFL